MRRKLVLLIILTLVIVCMLGVSFRVRRVEASGTIYIRADGSIEGTTDISTVNNVTYTFTDNIYDEIVVERDNVIVDGAGYAVQGSGIYDSVGIYLGGRSNTTIKNIEIREFHYGIYLDRSSDYNTISGNNITNNMCGIELMYSSNNSISGNNITNNITEFSAGISLVGESTNNIISENVITNHRCCVSLFSGFYPSGNTISRNIIAEGNSYGIHIMSTGDTISENNITDNLSGIWVWFGLGNHTISGNNITNNARGVFLHASSNNTISGNNITNNQDYGIELYRSFNNNISRNYIANNTEQGVDLLDSSNNVVSGNRIKNNSCAISLGGESSGNIVYHNEFLNNAEQVHSSNLTNVWDDGVGKGNCWSDYEDRYPNATELDGSGIWDTPYVIDENNQDNYPLVPEFPTLTSIPLLLIVLTVAIAIYKRRLPKTPKDG